MKKSINTILILLIGIHIYGQSFSSSDPAYVENVKAGESALNEGNYDSCLEFYEKAFKIKQTSVLSTLRAAACAYSAENKTTLELYLNTAFELDWDQTKNIFESYDEFEYLYGTSFDERINLEWNNSAKAAGLNLKLMEELKEISITDQAQRKLMREVREKHGFNSPQMDSLWAIQMASDKANLERIEEMIEEYGYPGKSMVGSSLASTPFMVIQHSSQEAQEKYLPLLKEMADKNEIRWSSVALMVDRVLLGQGKKQIYGSQIHSDQETGELFFGEIENPFKIDSIRSTVGLGPLQQYADHWDLTWDPKKHIDRHQANSKK